MLKLGDVLFGDSEHWFIHEHFHEGERWCLFTLLSHLPFKVLLIVIAGSVVVLVGDYAETG